MARIFSGPTENGDNFGGWTAPSKKWAVSPPEAQGNEQVLVTLRERAEPLHVESAIVSVGGVVLEEARVVIECDGRMVAYLPEDRPKGGVCVNFPEDVYDPATAST